MQGNNFSFYKVSYIAFTKRINYYKGGVFSEAKRLEIAKDFEEMSSLLASFKCYHSWQIWAELFLKIRQ